MPSAKAVRAVIVDDHAIVRVGLRVMLERADIEVVGEADTARKALSLVEATKPHVVLLAATLRDRSGLSSIAALREASKRTRVLSLTIEPDPELAQRAIAAGAHGCAHMGLGEAELVRAVQTVARGKRWTGARTPRGSR